jgi:hypothetical protein
MKFGDHPTVLKKEVIYALFIVMHIDISLTLLNRIASSGLLRSKDYSAISSLFSERRISSVALIEKRGQLK